MGFNPAVLGVLFGSQNKEAHRLMKTIQASEVEVSSVHNIEGSGFENNPVQNIDIVEFAIGNVNEGRDIALQVKQCMEFYG